LVEPSHPEAPPPPRAEYDDGFDAGYDVGFNAGYNAGYNAGSEAMWEIGYLDCLTQATFADLPLPLGYGLSDLVAEAVRSVDAGRRGAPTTLRVREVYQRMTAALSFQAGLSVVALGGVEILELTRGSRAVDTEAKRQQIGKALRQADIVGVPVLHHFDRQPKALEVLFDLDVPVARLHLTDSAIAYLLHAHGFLRQLLIGRVPPPRVLVVGNSAEHLAAALQEQGVRTTGWVSPAIEMHDVEQVLSAVDPSSFDIALIDAGLPGIVMCAEIADRFQRIVLDIGTIATHLARGRLRI
jgi:hypothetical protein